MNIDESGVDGEGGSGNEPVVIESENGGHITFTDADHDGDADLMVELDEHGTVLAAARYDESSGEWIAVDPVTAAVTCEDGQHEADPPPDREPELPCTP